jgi:nucleotide-binding universal stress UspA family protein
MTEFPQAPGISDDADVRPAPDNSIVVGHDRSAGARDALEVALQLAADLGTPLVVVRAWSIITAPRPATWRFGTVSTLDELGAAVRDQMVTDTSSQVSRFPEVSVGYDCYHAAPAKTLIAASAHARMLVVGPRGLGGFQQLVLGSVSEQCVRHAHCPVLVIRAHAA